MKKLTRELFEEAIDEPLDFGAIEKIASRRIEQMRECTKGMLRKLRKNPAEAKRIAQAEERLHDLDTNLERSFQDEHVAEVLRWIGNKKTACLYLTYANTCKLIG